MYPDDLLYDIALSKIFRYRVNIPGSIIDNLGSAKALFEMSRDMLEEIFTPGQVCIDEILNRKNLDEARAELEWCREKGIRIHHRDHPDFPPLLRSCPDAPVVFYSFGSCNLNSDRIISIVGTRLSSSYGEKMCRKIVADLSESGVKPVIASGLAFGIDICAHLAALDNGLDTIAILANPLDRIYPAAHTSHARKIVKQGSLLTEFPRGSESFKINFVQRNRLIAGLSAATIIVESRAHGGALITAELAHSYSREVFAVPGRIGDIRSEGCNNLIAKNVAAIFTSAEDLLTALGWVSEKQKESGRVRKLFYEGNPDKEKILVALRLNPELNIDELHSITGQKIQELTARVVELEIEGYICSVSGNRYSAV
ncbi:MAG: DNA-protecting protein DprA [Bacteroidetes bacterium HGW-Bacteroidetes-14]|jgi:DNA processing protein|nr:MAG: DNA-protecting protein DprA [Bacteroidetes bacterium HGW-Bacteroidetes-14]